MNSKERRNLRYQRRKARREARINDRTKFKDFDSLFSFHNLYIAGKQVCNHARWKKSVINFESIMLKKVAEVYSNIHYNTRKFPGFHSWVTTDRGKARDINSLPIAERALQKCLCFNMLVPLFSKGFIYDNSACIKNKGMSFTLKRLKRQLSEHYRKYGLNGGIYQFDFKDYFLSLPHEGVKERLRCKIKDDKIYDLAASFIDDFQYMKGILYDKKGLSLGTEISYIMALEYVNPLDHYIKEVLKVKGYARYMDDGYIIAESIEKLKEIQKLVHAYVEKLGVKLNEEKDKIIPFKNHGFTFLKMRVHLDKKGKVILRLSRKSIRVMRSKLRKFRKWLDTKRKKRFGIEDIVASYQSWRAYAKQCDSYKSLRNMDIYFINLFRDELKHRKLQFKCSIDAILTPEGWVYETDR